MSELSDQDVVVVGAGVIGLTSALALQRAGRKVLVVDPNPPGSGASMGNAGTIADFAIAPVGSPTLLKRLPELLFDRAGPFSIRQAALGALLPWLARFAWQSLPGKAQRNMQAIAALTKDAGPRWQDLADSIGAAHLLKASGCVYAYASPAEFASAKQDLSRRAAFGVPLTLLSPADLAELEPGWPRVDGGAVLFPNAQSVIDPQGIMQALTTTLIEAGAELCAAAVDTLSPHQGRVVLSLQDGRALTARQVVVAAGAHSKPFCDQIGDLVPLDTERGYHLEFDGQETRLSRPVCSAGDGFYCAPMVGRLRAAGTVELGGTKAPQTEARVANLARRFALLFPDLPKASRAWMGFRPSMPDSRPVISLSKRGRQVVYAFGHGHIGLTLAPVTAELVTALIEGTEPLLSLADYRVDRF